jgi:hypothetical protein
MNKIILKHSEVPGRKPKGLALGEVAINTADGVIFFRAPCGKVHELRAAKHNLAIQFLGFKFEFTFPTRGKKKFVSDF